MRRAHGRAEAALPDMPSERRRLREIGFRDGQGGAKSEGDAGDQRQEQAVEEHAMVEGTTCTGHHILKPLCQPVREQDSQQSAGSGKQHALGQELGNEAGAAGAQRKTDTELTAADGGAGEEEAGQVGAGDKEDDGDGEVEAEDLFEQYANVEVAEKDHRLISELTWNSFRNHLILEYEIPKYDGDIGRPNFFMPLETSLCQEKLDHVFAAFESQRTKPWFDREAFLGLMRIRGIESNSASGYAEAFHARKLICGGLS